MTDWEMARFSVNYKGKEPSEIEADSLTAREALISLGVKAPERLVAVRIDGELRDLSSPLEKETEIEPVYLDSEAGLEILRHSTSHVMALAVKELFPGVKVTIGPAIENGFYYDFDYERPFKEEDLEAIEKKMQEIIDADLPFSRDEMKSQEALKFFKSEGEDYKVELINDLGAEEVSLLLPGQFYGFVPRTSHTLYRAYQGLSFDKGGRGLLARR
jgi:threonyl-tRNA synthetase